MNARVLVVVVVMIAGAGLLAFWVYQNFELQKQTYRSGYSEEALRNPFLAAEMYLDRVGIEAESVSGRDLLLTLPQTGEVLIVNDFGPDLSDEAHAQLIRWLEAGGYMIMVAKEAPATSTGRRLLDEYQITVHRPEDPEISVEAIPVDAEDALPPVTFSGQQYLSVNEGEGYPILASELGVHVAEVRIGEGLLTVLSDSLFMSNPPPSSDWETVYRIDDTGHAYFLSWLLPSDRKVWLLYSTHHRGLLPILWDAAPLLCLATVLLLVIWVWWMRDRFGSPLQNVDRPRRDVMEQLLATGRFEWQSDRSLRRVEETRRLFQTRLEKRHPRLRHLTSEERVAYLANVSSLPADSVRQAMFATWSNENELVDITHQLQAMNEDL
ncbi:MAG: DUF4350 domain-containing protein [Pseudomonadota bacterium]